MSAETVQGKCPACDHESLFLGAGGYVTCSRLDCPSPTEASDLLAVSGMVLNALRMSVRGGAA